MRTPFIFGRTERCCVCYAIATNWNGWLRKSRDGIVAGFCEQHKPKDESINSLRGIYNKNMEATNKNLNREDVIRKLGLDKNLIEQ